MDEIGTLSYSANEAEAVAKTSDQARSSTVPQRYKRRSQPKDILTVFLSCISVPLFLLLWEWVGRSRIVNPVLFPPPSVVLVALRDWITSGEFMIDLLSSAARVTAGFAAGSIAGIAVGILTGRYRLVSALIGPIFQILRPIPPVAFVPIIVLWFGLSEWGKLFLVFWGAFFTVWLATHLGVQKVDDGLVRAARVLGTPRHRLLFEIILLGALPFIVVGLRTAVSISFYSLVAAELAGAFSGVFYRIEVAQQNMQTGRVLAGLLVLGGLSLLADRGFALLSQRLVWWR